MYRRRDDNGGPSGIGGHAVALRAAGDVPGHGRAVFTAIGDPVNVASRLQSVTKRLGVEAVISDAVFDAAGVEPDLPRQEIDIDGRTQRLWIRPVAQAGQRWRESAFEEA